MVRRRQLDGTGPIRRLAPLKWSSRKGTRNLMFLPCIFKVNHFYLPTNALNCINLRRLKSTCVNILKDKNNRQIQRILTSMHRPQIARQSNRYVRRAASTIAANPLLQDVIAEFNTASYLNGINFVTFNVTLGLHTTNQLLQLVRAN